ncbi:MAG: hypothetical protein JWN87_368 [Frankiales bacterium]|nr:hypothetical protein [Frankiales bacterium]
MSTHYDAATRARWRSAMGHGASVLAVVGGHAQVEPGWFVALSGLPDPDANLALVHHDDPAALAAVLREVERVGAPAAVILAGDGTALAARLPAGWDHVGAMPFMTLALASAAVAADPRVRPAGTADGDAVVALFGAAFGLAPEVAEMIRPLIHAGAPTRVWLLEDDGQPVSAVVAGRVGDVETIWCMSTPQHFARRGYGRALLNAVLAAAKAEGATVALLGATEAGFPLYDATGWQTVEPWEMYVQGGH